MIFMFKSKKSKSFGVTLIETLIYVALIGLIVSSIVLLTSAVLNSRMKTRSSLVLEENMRFAIEGIKRKVFLASDISSPSVGEEDNGLTIAINDPAKDPTIFSLINGAIMIKEGNNEMIEIISDEVEITNLSFIGLDSDPSSVKIEMAGQLRNASGRAQSTYSLSDTAVIRR